LPRSVERRYGGPDRSIEGLLVTPPAGELHILPHHHSGRWLVGTGEEQLALSWHTTANEAEDAAKRYASDRGTNRIFLHDRYERVRMIAPREARSSTRR
jgi:hypothetical protein